jgi:hypothetical protein
MSTPSYRITYQHDEFIADYPEFALLNPTRGQRLFNIAQDSLLDNTWGSPVRDDAKLWRLFELLVAHLTTLYGIDPTNPFSTNGSTRPPGTLTSATEGSVSASYEVKLPEGSAIAPWYAQTEYGLQYWSETAQYRSAKYFVCGDSGVGYSRNFRGRPFFNPGGV